MQVFPFLCILISICYFLSFDKSHPNRFELRSNCRFDLHFPGEQKCWAIYEYLLFICLSSLEKCLSPLPIFNWVIFFFFCYWAVWGLVCFDINPLLDIWFTNIFTHPVDFPFILMMISFAVQIFSFIKPFLFTFAFVAIVFPVKSKKKKSNAKSNVKDLASCIFF